MPFWHFLKNEKKPTLWGMWSGLESIHRRKDQGAHRPQPRAAAKRRSGSPANHQHCLAMRAQVSPVNSQIWVHKQKFYQFALLPQIM